MFFVARHERASPGTSNSIASHGSFVLF